ncbi:MAG TPA: hypothetical protein VKH17_02595 [Acidimicrobiia bacterium]|nr:hypothetical protein [Acidimicrobiia bacterium]
MSIAVDDAAARRRFVRACVVGGAVAAVGFVWMLAIGRLDLLHSGVLSGLYDAQAHRLLAGHWDVPLDKLTFEAFLVHGKTYMYFGPWPAVLRLPIAALTDRFDGELTQLSMIAAFVVLLVATSRLLWRARRLLRPGRPVTRWELGGVAVFVLVVGAGSVVMFLASRPVVYHEVELWGAALSLAAYDAILGFIERANRRALAWAAVLSGLALLTRGSVGIGPVIALGLVLVGRLLATGAARLRRPNLARPLRWLGLGDSSSNRGYLLPLALVIAVPLVLYMYVNYAKFGHPWNLPITRQYATFTDPIRQSVYEHNGGKLFSPKFVPTNLVAILRPDALGLDRLFPFVTFPSRATLVGGIQFAARDPSSSIPASMPFLFVLSLIGVWTVFRPRRSAEPGPANLRVPVIGAAAGGIGAITIPFINQRYISDFVPLLVLLGIAGLYTLFRAVDRGVKTKVVTVGVTVVLVALAATSLWVNFALALVYQREYSPFPTEAERAAFVRFQYDFADSLAGGTSTNVRVGRRLPDPLPEGTVFVLGNCDAVYWSDGSTWHPIERTRAAGRYPLEVTFRDRPSGTRETLLTAGDPGAEERLGVEYLRDRRVRFWFTSPRLERELVGPTREIRPGRPVRLDVTRDTALGRLDVELDGDDVLVAYPLEPGPVTVAGEPGAAAAIDFSGDVRLGGTSHRFCTRITR